MNGQTNFIDALSKIIKNPYMPTDTHAEVEVEVEVEEETVHCDRCNAAVSMHDGLQDVDGQAWCEDCRERFSFCCEDCDHTFSNNASGGSNTNGDTICDSCADSY